MILVQVVYAAGPETVQQALVEVQLPADSTVKEAIQASGLLQQFPDIDLAVVAVGIFSRRVKLNDILHDADRVEIYRPLQIDPKEARKARYKRNRT